MYKLANKIWKILSSLLVLSVLTVNAGFVTAVLIKAFMFGFNLIWNFL